MTEEKNDKNKKNPETTPTPKKKQLGIGVALRREREKKRWGLERLAAKTKIKREYLVALEEEQFEKLEHTIYFRLFLRAYAKELGLDGDKLLKLYESHLEEQKPSREEEEKERQAARREKRLRWAATAVGLAAAVLMIGGLASRCSVKPDQPSMSAEAVELAGEIRRAGTAHFRVRGLGDTWLQVVENDVNTTIITLKKGEIRSWRTAGTIKFKVGNAYGLEAEWQGKPLGILGARGQVVSRKLSVAREED